MSHPAPLRLGLTGGVGSGKSTVSARLAEHGAAILDADAVSRASTAAGGSAIAAVARTFGSRFITAEGALDRNAMRELVYREPAARQRLEAIIHPLVHQELARQATRALDEGSPLLVFDIPLLVESATHWRGRLDRVLVVDCDRDTQIRRVQARDGLPLEQIHAILDAQATRAQRLALADHVIDNSAGVTLQQLHRQIDALARQLGL